ncbi:hypothetical protein [Aureispira anguillae]|uniref:non-specific serine/threonine protein kinase n=1 Tax=Aureispira anguillae TaxID=2864201 RepID=A0A915YHH3_9BACT|nr:hypothetical protein [Aureispira anguillae]BDS13163.1 hypothetical protein AsAng_0038910 [Aureispira anguillae]
MPNKLHFYTKYSKEKIKITAKPFASGGEGAIYPVVSPRAFKHLVAKIYYPEKRSPEREAKMKYLIQHPPIEFQPNQYPSIGWVQDLIYKDKRFIGILIVKIEGKKLTKLTLGKLPRRADKAWQRFAFGQKEALKLRLHTCFNLAVVIQQIHLSGRYVLVDLKPDNVLMQPNGLIAVVDMDSVEVIEDGKAIFSAPVATPEYTPPEHYWQKRDTIEETWDRFSLGVIFYQLLFGLHPFAGSCHPPYDHLVGLNDKIQHHLYVHHSQKKDLFKVIPPPHRQLYQAPSSLQELFHNCFEAGGVSPDLRPTAMDWCEVLADLLKLPFNKLPKLDIPPSNLYFLPSDTVRTLSMVIPPLEEKFKQEHILLPKPSISKDDKRIKKQLKNEYETYLKQIRYLFGEGLVVIIAIIVFMLFFPYLTVIGLLILFFGIRHFLVNPNQAFEKIGSNILSPSTYQLINIQKGKKYSPKEQLDMLRHTISAVIDKQQQQLTQQAQALEKHISLAFIEHYYKKRADLRQKQEALQAWAATAEAAIIQARKKELAAYRELSMEFHTKLKNDARYSAYFFNTYANLKTSLERTINVQQNTLDQIEQGIKTNIIHQQHQTQLQELKTQKEEQLILFQTKQNTSIEKALKKFKQKISRNRKREEDNYNRFLQRENLFQNQLKKSQQSIQKQLRRSLQKIRKELGLKSEQELTYYINLLKKLPTNEQLSLIQHQRQEELNRFRQLIIHQNIKNPHINIILQLLEKEIPFSQNTSNHPPSLHPEDLLKSMKHTSSAVEASMVELKTEINELVKDTSLHNNPVELAYWIKETEEKIKTVFFNLTQYSSIIEQLSNDPTLSTLKPKLNWHNRSVQKAEIELQQQEQAHHERIQKLKQSFAVSINFQNILDKELEEEADRVKKKTVELHLKSKEELAAFSKELDRKMTIEARIIDADYQEQVSLLKKESDQEKIQANEILAAAKKTQVQLNEDHQTFLSKIGVVRAEAEQTYAPQKLLLESQTKAIQTLAKDIQKDHPKAIHLFKQYKKNSPRIKLLKENYQQSLEEINQLQTEKIKLDALRQWQENHTTKIYIQDLLLNKLEQFEKKNKT